LEERADAFVHPTPGLDPPTIAFAIGRAASACALELSDFTGAETDSPPLQSFFWSTFELVNLLADLCVEWTLKPRIADSVAGISSGRGSSSGSGGMAYEEGCIICRRNLPNGRSSSEISEIEIGDWDSSQDMR
jgi:hypothetical protein